MWPIWPNMSGDGANRREFREKGLLLGNRSTTMRFRRRVSRGLLVAGGRGPLLRRGFDAWWCDCTEPFEADWSAPSR
jgi:alpha-D-xyloside xylohydrolase